MALQSSGAISLQDIANEFGGSSPHAISEYYRNGGLVPGNNTNIPTSGTIDFADFYGATNATTRTLSNGNTNVNLSQTFGTDWTSGIGKILIIPSGAEIGATGLNNVNRAITVPSGMGGTLTIQNAGTISGAGGEGGDGSPMTGGTGGSAIYIANANVTVQNTGTIRGGGGGGGKGNAGSPGSNGYQQNPSDLIYALNCWGGQGGSGGDGGDGQGYNSSAQSGASGGGGGGIYATGNFNGPEQDYCNIFNPHHGLSQTPGSPGTPGGPGGAFGAGGTTASPGGNGGPAGKYIELSGVSYTLQNSGTLTGTAP